MTAQDLEEPCSARCGYVGSGWHLLMHEVHEHVRCTECGSDPIGVHAVTHKLACPRLRPGYRYPPLRPDCRYPPLPRDDSEDDFVQNRTGSSDSRGSRRDGERS